MSEKTKSIAPVILVIEDEKAIFETLAVALEREGFKAIHAPTAASGLDSWKTLDPSLIILDVGLPDYDGYEVCRKVRASSNIPIIFLTARAEEIERILGLELGADDYVTKPFSPREVLSRIKAILRRTQAETKIPESDSQAKADWSFDYDRMQISYQGQILNLSRYEFRLLEVLAKRPGRVYSRSELMDRAWEDPDMSLERTVDAHIKSIRAKLRVAVGEQEVIITSRGFGYSVKE
jgi:two-component system catabolic regulation response regulator CreB